MWTPSAEEERRGSALGQPESGGAVSVGWGFAWELAQELSAGKVLRTVPVSEGNVLEAGMGGEIELYFGLLVKEL